MLVEGEFVCDYCSKKIKKAILLMVPNIEKEIVFCNKCAHHTARVLLEDLIHLYSGKRVSLVPIMGHWPSENMVFSPWKRGYVKAIYRKTNSGTYGGFLLSAELVKELKRIIGYKPYVDVSYGIDEKQITIVFEFKEGGGDYSIQKMQERNSFLINCSAIVKRFDLDGAVSENYRIEGSRLYVFFENRGES
ncbi:hypothetical protein [Geoglobus ahangari]